MVVVLFSGGHDSANLVKRAAPDCIAVFVDYGQAARLRELRAVLNICTYFDVEVRIERIEPLPIVDGTGDVVAGRYPHRCRCGVQ